MTKLRLAKPQQQTLIDTRDEINALAPEAGDVFLEQLKCFPVAWGGECPLSPSSVLERAFAWSNTLQGYSFWESIWKELVAQEKRDDA